MRLSLKSRALLVAGLLLILASQAGGAQLVNKIAAVVNGEMITLYDVHMNASAEIARRGLQGSDPQSVAARNAIFQQVLDAMIADILLRQEADRLKIIVADSEVENELRKLIQRSQLSPEEFEQNVVLQGGTMAKVRESIRNSILRQRVTAIMISRRVVVTKDEIAAYYEEHKSQFVQQDSVKISLIVFSPATDAEKVVASIKKGEISFADAARKYSMNSSSQAGGDLGSIAWRDLAPEWQDILGKMQPGDVSQVISNGYEKVALQLNSALSGSSQTLADATPQIEEILRGPKLQERFEEYVKQLRAKAVVDIRV